jgi:MoaA/NifB/PqqE/SkfB family radical SAM enzyme
MLALLHRLRLQWFLLTRSLGYGTDFTTILYKIYLNHDKIIHFRRGFPVYSLSTPAVFSAPAANFLARALYRTIQNKNLPNLMSFAVNDDCNAACEHCSFFEAVDDRARSPLSFEQACDAIAQAQDLGVSVLNFVGGEPLQRQDLPDLIRSVDRQRSTTVLFTNGWLLSDRARELRRAGLDSIYVSLDAADPAQHDRIRKTPGLFAKAIAGLKVAKKLGFSVGISTTLTPERYAAGELPRIIELAKRLGVHEVLVFDALPSGRYQDREDLVRSPNDSDWVEAMMRSVAHYNRDRTYPGVVFFAYFPSHRSVGCSCGTSYFYLSPDGDVMSCDFNAHSFGNIRNAPLWQLWERLTTTPDYCSAKWGGCKVKDPDWRDRISEPASPHPTLRAPFPSGD